ILGIVERICCSESSLRIIREFSARPCPASRRLNSSSGWQVLRPRAGLLRLPPRAPGPVTFPDLYSRKFPARSSGPGSASGRSSSPKPCRRPRKSPRSPNSLAAASLPALAEASRASVGERSLPYSSFAEPSLLTLLFFFAPHFGNFSAEPLNHTADDGISFKLSAHFLRAANCRLRAR